MKYEVMDDQIEPTIEAGELGATPPFVVTRVTDGLGFGEGSISGRVESPQVLSAMDRTINSPNIIVPVDADDDGCSDGRDTLKVYDLHGEIADAPSNRAKVFGGSATMAAASMIGLGEANGMFLQDVFGKAVNTLDKKGVSFGAHTAEAANGPDCGCGAIDKAPEAIAAAVRYEDDIEKAIVSLGIDPTGLEEVFDNFRVYSSGESSKHTGYRGRKVIERILSTGMVIKKLGGKHLEHRIVINQVRGYTVNQKLIRDVTKGRGQVFGIDTWRLQDIASYLFPTSSEERHKALLSGLVYTFGTSAVLTGGDLPVDMIMANT